MITFLVISLLIGVCFYFSKYGQPKGSENPKNHDYWSKNLHTLTKKQKQMYYTLQKVLTEGHVKFFKGPDIYTPIPQYIAFLLPNNSTLAYLHSNNRFLIKVENGDSFTKLDQKHYSEALSCLIDDYWDTIFEKERSLKMRIRQGI